MILIVSSEDDDHATAVLERLEQVGADARLLDLSGFPQRLTLSMEYGSEDGDDTFEPHIGRTSLADCNVVWWRRPQPFELSPALERQVDRSFAYTECQSAFSGLWRTLDAFWVNHPTLDEDAARKPYQLRLAQDVGFEVPETCITNDPERARAFVDRHGADRTVYKAFSATEQAWRETRVFRDGETDLLDAVRHAPVIFQEYVPAGVDLRITVMGDQVFPGAIYARETDYEVDYRMNIDTARIERADLPDEVLERIHAYMDRLGLVYGAIDMRRTPDGRYVFLEINPSGQWLFVENRTEMPLTETFAELLASRDGTGDDGRPSGEARSESRGETEQAAGASDANTPE